MNTVIQTFSTTNAASTSFDKLLNNFPERARQFIDQPWIRTGPSMAGPAKNVYVGYNDLTRSTALGGNGKTAAVNVSTDGGMTYTAKIVETGVPTSGQDGPSIREAVNGKTVYAVFTRWNDMASDSADGTRFKSVELVVKSTDFGSTFGGAMTVDNPISPFTKTDNTPLSLGNQRVGSDNAIAVGPNADGPNGPNRVVVAYVDSTDVGKMVVRVAESTDGGATWNRKFATPDAVRSAQPALTILANGDVALLYDSYTPGTGNGADSNGTLSQNLVVTTDDFATTSITVLAKEANSGAKVPMRKFDPYLGDFFDMTSADNVLYGIFSASNADTGDPATGGLGTFLNKDGASLFPRGFCGAVENPTFQICAAGNNPIDFSVDPFFFSEDLTVAPEPGTLILFGTSLVCLAVLRRRNIGLH